MNNVDVAWPIQAATLARLEGDATLAGLVTGIHDEPPEGSHYPYIVIGEATVTPRNAHDRFGAASTITIHIWSTYQGWKEGLEIASELIRLLDHQDLTIAGHDTVAVRHQQTVTLRDPQPRLRHIAVRFGIDTEHTP